jgi:hypothetical protein
MKTKGDIIKLVKEADDIVADDKLYVHDTIEHNIMPVVEILLGHYKLDKNDLLEYLEFGEEMTK